MNSIKLQPSEITVMNILWDHAPISASEVARILMQQTSWSKNTIYTLLTRVVNKGFAKRSDPNFVCEPLIRREQVQLEETKTLLDRLYSGSFHMLFARMLESEELTQEELDEMQSMIDQKR